MQLTISQIGSASPYWVARYVPAYSMGVRSGSANTAEPAGSVSAMPVVELGELETEYDQFGRFGASAARASDGGEPATAHRSGINASKHFRSGQVTVSELEQEYARSMLALTTGPDSGTDVRRFIPSGMTEYQVYQLYDFQYRWAIEVERRALARQAAETQHPARADVPAVESPGLEADFRR